MSHVRPRALLLLALAVLLACAGCGADNPPLGPELDEPLYRDGQQKKREGQNQAALADFLRVIAKRGDLAPESHMEAGLICRSYDPIAAIYHFNRYIELEPNSRQVPIVRDLINTAKRDFAKTLPLASAAMDGAAGHSDLLEEVNQQAREIDDLKARLASLRGEVAPLVAGRPVTDSIGAPGPVAVAVPAPVPEETAPAVSPVAPEALPPPPVAAPVRARPAAAPPSRTDHGHGYTVQAGDTLYRIAKKVYGTATAAKVHAIEDANRGVLTSAGSLKPGMELKIPDRIPPMPATSRRTAVLTESIIREMTRVAQRHDAINLSQGFPDHDPPRELIEAARAEMDEGHHQYAITWGAPPLRAALAEKIGRFTGLSVDPETDLVVTCGATEAMMAAMMTVCDPGGKVGLFSPFYENYSADAILSGAVPVHVPLHPPHYGFDPAELRRAFAGGLKAFILCNPSNPCGKVFSEGELRQIAALAEEFDTFVITDEVYEHIVFPPHRHTYFSTLPGMAARTLMCSALSKTFAITGWRLGYLHGAPEVIAQARKVHDFLTVGAAAPLQHAVVAGLRLPASYYDALARDYAGRRDILLSYLDRTGLSYTRPQGSYFVMVDISPFGYASDVEFSHWMTREIGVAPVPGSSFFAEPENRYVRLNFAKRPETLHAAGERLLKLRR